MYLLQSTLKRSIVAVQRIPNSREEIIEDTCMPNSRSQTKAAVTRSHQARFSHSAEKAFWRHRCYINGWIFDFSRFQRSAVFRALNEMQNRFSHFQPFWHSGAKNKLLQIQGASCHRFIVFWNTPAFVVCFVVCPTYPVCLFVYFIWIHKSKRSQMLNNKAANMIIIMLQRIWYVMRSFLSIPMKARFSAATWKQSLIACCLFSVLIFPCALSARYDLVRQRHTNGTIVR